MVSNWADLWFAVRIAQRKSLRQPSGVIMQKSIPIAGLLLFITTLLFYQVGLAASGTPSSPQFGYGARLDILGTQIEASLHTATQAGLDWIAIEYDWATYTPNTSTADLSVLDQTMSVAAENNLNVLISITHPPQWCMSENGPDPETAANLGIQLAKRYPDTFLALEWFPAANTTQGWGTAANPSSYAQLLQTVQQNLQQTGEDNIVIVAGGLIPLTNPEPGDINDLDFLTGLYQANAETFMPIISIRLPKIANDLLATPSPSGGQLRQFEAIRQVMLNNNHERGLIWITDFSWPERSSDPQVQAEWLVGAYQMLQSYLYLGAAFFNPLNPSSNTSPSLVNVTEQNHPALSQLATLIASRRAIQLAPTSSCNTKKNNIRRDFKHLQDIQP